MHYAGILSIAPWHTLHGSPAAQHIKLKSTPCQSGGAMLVHSHNGSTLQGLVLCKAPNPKSTPRQPGGAVMVHGHLQRQRISLCIALTPKFAPRQSGGAILVHGHPQRQHVDLRAIHRHAHALRAAARAAEVPTKAPLLLHLRAHGKTLEYCYQRGRRELSACACECMARPQSAGIRNDVQKCLNQTP